MIINIFDNEALTCELDDSLPVLTASMETCYGWRRISGRIS